MIHFNKYGSSNKTLVLLHGLCENTEIWNHTISELSEKYSILSFDLPGFGKSNINTFVSINEMAKLIQNEINALQIKNPILIGHSMGGYVALAYAHLFAEEISGLILFHSTAYNDDDDKKIRRKKQIQSIVKYGKVPFLKNLYLGLFAEEFNNETAKQKIWHLLNHAPENGIINALEAMIKRDDHTKTIQNSIFPILILAGGKDKIIPLDTQKELEKLSKNCKLVTLEKSGHMGMVEEPQKSISILRSFCEEIF